MILCHAALVAHFRRVASLSSRRDSRHSVKPMKLCFYRFLDEKRDSILIYNKDEMPSSLSRWVRQRVVDSSVISPSGGNACKRAGDDSDNTAFTGSARVK